MKIPSAAVSICFLLIFYVFAFSQEEDGYVPVAEVMPVPKGGYETIYKKIVYPEIAKRSGVSGKVFLLVYITERGSVDKVQVLKGIGAGCDEAAINGVKQVTFEPGKNGGVPVKVKLSMSINFKI